LQAVVKLLGEGKELRATLDDAPSGLDADRSVSGGEDFRNAAAVLRRAHIDNGKVLDLRCLAEDAVNRLRSNQGPVFLDRVQA
jgi:hypothetical protein